MNTARLSFMKCLAVAAAGALCASASAQQLSLETFEDDGNILWYMNGNQVIMDDGRGIDGPYINLPFADYWGFTLSDTEAQLTGLTGDLTVHPSLTVTLDLANFAFLNFDFGPIDPESRPIIFQLWDEGDPENFFDDVSVWFRGPAMPSMDAGWVGYTFEVPVPAGGEMPAGWGGTGDEDPVTYEPKLPDHRTFRSVLQNVTRVSISTFEPGYFYAASYIDFGADNVEVFVGGACRCDVDGNGLAVSDIFAFLAIWFAGDTAADFDGQNGVGVPDIFAFLACWFGGCGT
jgi:hypothetical protein